MTSATTPARILIVEDELIVARDISEQLVQMGYERAGHATRGEEAIALAGQLRPDLVLMDIQLAGAMDGIAAAQTIRTQFGLPVVFITGFDVDDTLERAQLVEPHGYVVKPFIERELRGVLKMALYKHRAEARLSESAQHVQAILDNMLDGVITISAQGLIESYNPAASLIFGYTEQEALGHNVALLMPQAQRAQHDAYLSCYKKTGQPHTIGTSRQVNGQRKDGSVFPLSLSLSEISRHGKHTFIGIVRDLSQQKKDADLIHQLAYFDPLTGLPNRLFLADHIKQVQLKSERSGQHGALLLFDLDHFKQLNESLGFEVGDLLLQQAAARLQALVPEGLCVARLGGDEFMLVIESLSQHANEALAQIELSVNQTMQTLGQPYVLRDHAYSSTTSLGIVIFCGVEHSVGELFKNADIAMYAAKNAGRNTWCYFDASMQAAVLNHAARINDLRRGLSQQEFVLHYQIQVNRHGTAIGAEALVRWNHATRGLVSPAEFITLAEETRLILPLGQWVLEGACAQLREWASQPATANWTMAVNVSALQFVQADFVATVAATLASSGADACRLKLELTESMLVSNVPDVIIKMNHLKALGVKFSLDDFGTGYSSLSFLKLLPLDQLKIDQSFVRDLLLDANDASIARAIVAMGHSLGLKVIAEGVESTSQYHMLAALHCDAFQGYYFGRPGVAADLTKLVSAESV
jgi:diguanylate cyclase (GGDEF)-like protein/PAS domain S-box-containing protein